MVSAALRHSGLRRRGAAKFTYQRPGWKQVPLPWGSEERARKRARRKACKWLSESKLAIERALEALRKADREGAGQDVLRDRYFELEAAMAADECHHEQLELELYDGVRLDRWDRLTKIGKDPEPDRAFEASSPTIQGFAELFPEGMTFTEIGWVLGCRKQQAFKLYLRGTAKMLRALGTDAEKIRDHLRAESERASGWDQMMGT